MGSLDDETGDGIFDQLFQELSATLKTTDQLENLSKQFAKLNTDLDRVNYVLTLDCIDEIFKLPTVGEGKSSVVSLQLRNQGNKLFQEKRYEHALKLYNDSVAYAPGYRDGADRTCKELALAMANRSAALFYLQSYDLCLQDCDWSLQFGYPDNLHYKLYDRKGKCLVKLGRSAEARVCFEKAQKALDKCELERKKKMTWTNDMTKWIEKCKDEKLQEEEVAQKLVEDKIVPILKYGSHERFLSLSKACNVTYTPEQGRFIVAAQDIEPGEVILVEKPFASVLLPTQYSWHCHHCYQCYLVAVPCHQCAYARFCSEKCHQDALQSYHKTECACLDIVHKSGMGKFGHLALRTVTKSGLQFFVNYYQELKSGKHDVSSKELEGCSPDGTYNEDDYNAIYHLVTHASDRSTHDLFRRASKAVYLLKCLDQSAFFTEFDSIESESVTLKEIRYFVGGCILSHLQSLPCNAHEISELELDRTSVATSMASEIGAGIYSTLSLFNHSCDPAVNRNFYQDTCVVRAIKYIVKGEEVADNYGAVYAVQDREERKQKLKPQYYFECQCLACVQNWPLYPDIPSDNPGWKCEKCGEIWGKRAAAIAECKKCQNRQNEKENLQFLLESNTRYEEAFSKLMKCDVAGSLPILIQHLSFLDKHVTRPWRDINNCQETLKQCFSILGNCHVIHNV